MVRTYSGGMTKTVVRSEGRPLRSDAARNRVAIVDAAAEVFATRGADVDVREIARRAGVGMGTLYRHFATKGELLDTVLQHDFAKWTLAASAQAAAEGDPAKALWGFLYDALARQAQHRALVERCANSWTADSRTSAPEIAACQQELHPVIDGILARCHAAGALRPGVSGEDISLLLVALGQIALLAGKGHPERWQRLLQIAFDGLQAGRDTELPSHQHTIDQGMRPPQ